MIFSQADVGTRPLSPCRSLRSSEPSHKRDLSVNDTEFEIETPRSKKRTQPNLWYIDSMKVALAIPDHLAEALRTDGSDLSRRALEALAIEEYRAGCLTVADVGRLLGLPTRDGVDGFLKAHEAFDPYGVADLERERSLLRTLGY
jgi:hypothetical protein